MFMLNDFRIDLFFIHFSNCVFVFTLQKEVDSGYKVQTVTGDNEIHQVICCDKMTISHS